MHCFYWCRSPFKTGELRASRLCKAGFDFRFSKLAKDTGNLHLIHHSQTYADKKKSATDYLKARDRLYEFFHSSMYGEWLARPEELEAFSAESQWTLNCVRWQRSNTCCSWFVQLFEFPSHVAPTNCWQSQSFFYYFVWRTTYILVEALTYSDAVDFVWSALFVNWTRFLPCFINLRFIIFA